MRGDRLKALVVLLALVLIQGLLANPDIGQLNLSLTSLLGGAPPHPVVAQIGRIKTVSGTASVIRGSEYLPAQPGMQVYQGDLIETAADGSIGITFVDDSVYSAGPGSQLALSEFRFDVDNSRGNMLAELKSGTLAVVSGEITHTTPGAMSIKTPSSILGVRGTTFAVEVVSVGLCQCAIDGAMRTQCLPSAHSCQAACGSVPYAFSPASRDDIAACPAQERYADERYVVLPNADGRDGSGAITVSRGSTATTLDQAYAAAELRDGETNSIAMDAAQAEGIFQRAIAARPALPAHFRLNFLLDSDQMTPEAAAAFPSVVADIGKRQIYEVTLIGYTDTLANEAHNKRLSQDRAAAIRSALVKDGVDPQLIAVEGRGQSEQLVPTAQGVAEPRNRRVEVVIR
jgi:outer membrane protein OmpA-like peptidoglycan-associated protein